MTPEILCDNPKIELYEGDCLEILPTFPDKSFDLVLTDPPYGLDKKIGAGGGKMYNSPMKVDYRDKQWDKKPTDETINKLLILGDNSIIFGGNYFELPPTRGIICWDKHPTLPSFSDWEYFGEAHFSARIIKERHDKHRYHATQKPTKLIERLISDFSKESDTILDPFAGSGTTGEAAFKLNRNCTMIEIAPKYCDIIRKRIDVLARQERLFK